MSCNRRPRSCARCRKAFCAFGDFRYRQDDDGRLHYVDGPADDPSPRHTCERPVSG